MVSRTTDPFGPRISATASETESKFASETGGALLCATATIKSPFVIDPLCAAAESGRIFDTRKPPGCFDKLMPTPYTSLGTFSAAASETITELRHMRTIPASKPKATSFIFMSVSLFDSPAPLPRRHRSRNSMWFRSRMVPSSNASCSASMLYLTSAWISSKRRDVRVCWA